jgi:hypothetical protein
MAIYLSAHYRVLSFLLIFMAYSITTNTRFAGSANGTYLNDLTSRMSFPPSISSRFYSTYLNPSVCRAIDR